MFLLCPITRIQSTMEHTVIDLGVELPHMHLLLWPQTIIYHAGLVLDRQVLPPERVAGRLDH